MGKAVIKAADSAGVNIVPTSFGSAEEAGQTVEVCGKEILVHGPTEREKVLSSVFDKYPELIVVDYTIPSAVNGTLLYPRKNIIMIKLCVESVGRIYLSLVSEPDLCECYNTSCFRICLSAVN